MANYKGKVKGGPRNGEVMECSEKTFRSSKPEGIFKAFDVSPQGMVEVPLEVMYRYHLLTGCWYPEGGVSMKARECTVCGVKRSSLSYVELFDQDGLPNHGEPETKDVLLCGNCVRQAVSLIYGEIFGLKMNVGVSE